jgi:hypothetical protein
VLSRKTRTRIPITPATLPVLFCIVGRWPVTVKLKADKLIIKRLYFGGYNHIIKRYWEIKPKEIYLKCLKYGHTSYKGYSETPKCYIYAGNHETNEHKCPIINCFTLVRKTYIHLLIECIYCKGLYSAISNNCPKRRAVIEEVKKKTRCKESKRE